MRPQHITFTMAAADADGICASQKPTEAGNLTIAGDLATGGVATLDVPRHVSITSASDESGDTFTITGTDRYGNALTEEITGPNATTVKGTKNFKTVTTVATDGAATGNITVGSADEADSQLFVTDVYGGAITYGVDLSSGADMTTEVKYTLDSIWSSSFSQETANYIADLGANVSDYEGSTDKPITGIRLEITGFTSGTAYFHLIQSSK